MRYIARFDESDIKKVFGKLMGTQTDNIDIYLDADNRLVAEIEIADKDLEKDLFNDSSTVD